MPPTLIRLQTIPNPDIAGGLPTPVYVNPEAIAMVVRTIGSYRKEGLEDFHPRIECTAVFIGGTLGGAHVLVLETPEEVAALQERAASGALVN